MSQSLEARYERAKQALFCRYYESRLNARQREAVCTTEGPLLVLAGAGSGKTTVLISRIVHLLRYGSAFSAKTAPIGIDEGTVLALEALAENASISEIEEILPVFIKDPCPPYRILAITFTNKAAAQIRERLASALGDESLSRDVWSGTFHSICLRILRKYPVEAGYAPDFTIYDQDDQKRLVSTCMKELQIDEKVTKPKDVLTQISHAKDALISPADFQTEGDFRLKKIASVYALYQKKLKAANALDYDDIICATVRLLQNCEAAREYCQRKFRYVLVDEFQDTNRAQLVLCELLAGGTRNLMVVGDDDQSIYRFRGATVENILQFDSHYPDAHVVKLEQNYRSTGRILAAANAVISHNETRHRKTLWCDAPEGELITLYSAQTAEEEARYIMDTVLNTVVTEHRRYRDFAILYRVNEFSRRLESTLIKSGMPYRVVGGQRFYDRKEIRDILAYLYLVYNPRDNQRLKRIANEPKRQIGDTTLEAVEALGAVEGRSMLEIMRDARSYPALSRAALRLEKFAEMIDSFRAKTLTVSELLRTIYQGSGYEMMLLGEGEEGKERDGHVKELIASAIEYEQKNEDATLASFLEEVALVSDVDKYDENADAMVLMTVHSAKGLEFPIVFLAGMEDGVFPSQRNLDAPEELSEERRLAYVAITRAREKLYITHARERMLYNHMNYAELSCFVREELPSELLRRLPEPRPRPGVPYGGIGVQTGTQSRYYGKGDFSTSYAREWQKSSYGTSRPTSPQKSGYTPSPRTNAPERLDVGTRVRHAALGDGIILEVADMKGDYIYTIQFDNGTKKRLMATYAKLKRI